MTLGTVAILARLVSPEAFGTIAVIIMVALVAIMIGDFGLGPALIRAPEVDDRMLSGVFWSIVAISLALAGAIAATADWIALLFRDPGLAEPLRVSALIVPLTSVRSVHRALLERSLQFRKAAIADTAGTIFGSLAGIVAALAGADVWALVIQQLGLAGGTSAAFFVAVRWRPLPVLPVAEHRAMFRFGVNLTMHHVVGLLTRHASRPIISRTLGLDALGFYTVAAQIIDYPIQNIASVMQRIMFPVFSRAQEDDARLRHMHLAVMHAICLVVLPLTVVVMLLSAEITALVLGPGWEPVSGLLVYLALAGAFSGIGVPNTTLFLVKNRTGLQFRLGLISSVIVILAQLVGVAYGLQGVAMAYAAAMLLSVSMFWAVAFRLIGQTIWRVVSTLAPTLASTATMALVIFLLRPFCGPEPIVVILLCGTAGAVAFLAAEAILDRDRLTEVLGALLGRERRSA